MRVEAGGTETPSAFALAGGQRGCEKSHSRFCRRARTDHYLEWGKRESRILFILGMAFGCLGKDEQKH